MVDRASASFRFLFAAWAIWLATCPAWFLQAEDDAEDLVRQAGRLASQGKSAEAVAAATRALASNPRLSDGYYLRGREHFRLGKINESAADFDKYVELAPTVAPRQWERGITLYYAGRFADGAKQFEDYQTFDNRDVENSVWRYLCLARDVGVAKARETMLPIERDPRVPMMDVYELYRGNRSADDVLKAAQTGDPSPETLAGRLFYAHLYLGLFFEAGGDAAQARKYITLAADKKLAEHPRINRYMWDVARIHFERLERGPTTPRTPAKP